MVRLKLYAISMGVGTVLTPVAGVLGALLLPHMFFFLVIAGSSLITHGRILSGLGVIFGVPALIGLHCGSWIVTLIALPLLAVACRNSIHRLRWLSPVCGFVSGILATPIVHLADKAGFLPFASKFIGKASDLPFLMILGGVAGALIGLLFGTITIAIASRVLILAPRTSSEASPSTRDRSIP